MHVYIHEFVRQRHDIRAQGMHVCHLYLHGIHVLLHFLALAFIFESKCLVVDQFLHL
jgi:hypothetical protein